VISDLVLRSDEASLATILQACYLEGKGFACRSSALAAARGILLLPCLEGACFHDTVEVKSALQNSPAADPASGRSASTSKHAVRSANQKPAQSARQCITIRTQGAAAEGRDRQAGLVAALAAWVRPQQRTAFSAWLRSLRAAAESRQLVRCIASPLQCTNSCRVGL
jgi:hypothetical protein